MTSRLRVWVIAALLVGIALGCPYATGAEVRPASRNLVVVSEDKPTDGSAGCDALSVFDLDSDTAVVKGRTHISPGRLGAATDFSVILATQTNWEQFIYALWPRAPDYSTWTVGSLYGAESATFGGIAVLDDGNSFLVATAKVEPPGGDSVLRNNPPYEVRRYRMPQGRGDGLRVGPELGRFSVDGVAVEIMLDRDQKTAHVLTEAGTVYSIDVGSMAPTGRPVHVAPLEGRANPVHGTPLNHIHATMTADGRYLVTNRGRTPEVSVVDLVARRSWTLALSPDLKAVGGLAIATVGSHAGLLAVHAADTIALFGFDPDGPLAEAARVDVRQPASYGTSISDLLGPLLSIAWSGDGEDLIAATDAGTAEFVVLGVSDGGRVITPRAYLTACAIQPNYPNDILAIGLPISTATLEPPTATLPHPTSTSTITPAPTRTHSSTPPPPPTTTPASTASATPEPTFTPTTPPTPSYLPLLLREHCDPTHERSDIALVLDTSSSMTGQKLADAKAAALRFVEMVDLAPGRSQVAVIRYDRDAEVVCELTNVWSAIEAGVRDLQVRSWTHIDKGLRAALAEIKSPRHLERNQPVILLLTDGVQTGTPGEELRAAAEVRAAGVRLYTIGLGADVDEDSLKAMTGNYRQYFHTADSDDLARIYGDIATDLMCPGKDLWGGR
jgi:uncharacterized protein YegL